MNDLVSIVMPSYNTAQYIAESIKSVQAQSYMNWELLIVDDCSTDDTERIVKSYLSDSRIRFLRNDVNRGAAISRNRALKEARGRWIAFLDSDDLWMPNKLEKQISFMESKGYHFSYTKYAEIDADGNRIGKIITGPNRITKAGFYNYCWPGCLTVMYDAEYIGVIQITDLKKNNDYAMWLKVSTKANCYYLDEELALYRRGRVGSVSNHSFLALIIWHYRLFRISEGQSSMRAMVNTVRNMIFATIKKLHYAKKMK